MRTILINHMLEPPGRVTGITRFLFALLNGLLNVTDDQLILATCWSAETLPEPLRNSRLIIATQPFFRSNTINMLKQRLTLPALMKKYGADIEFNANPVGSFGASWPRIMTVHDLYLDLMPQEYSRKTVFVGTRLMKLSTRHAAGILVPSESTKRDLQHFYPQLAERSFVVHEAPANLDTAEIATVVTPERYGLIVGNLSPNKNIGNLIAALSILQAQGLRIPFIHVGRDDNSLIAQQRARFNAGMLIESRQNVSDAELMQLYRKAAFFIAPSLHEGFCLPLVEAQSCGTPVIASNCSALPEVAGDGALFIDPRSPQDIAQAMRRIWSDEILAGDLSRRAKNNAARFSWDKAAGELHAQIERILTATQHCAQLQPMPIAAAIQPDRRFQHRRQA